MATGLAQLGTASAQVIVPPLPSWPRTEKDFPNTEYASHPDQSPTIKLGIRGGISDICLYFPHVYCFSRTSTGAERAEATAQVQAIQALAGMQNPNDFRKYDHVDWEVGPNQHTIPRAASAPNPGDPTDPCLRYDETLNRDQWRIDIVVAERSILEVKHFLNVAHVQDQLDCYIAEASYRNVEFTENADLTAISWKSLPVYASYEPTADRSVLCAWAPSGFAGHIYYGKIGEPLPPDVEAACKPPGWKPDWGRAIEIAGVILAVLAALLAALALAGKYGQAPIPALGLRVAPSGSSFSYEFAVPQMPVARQMIVDWGDGTSETRIIPADPAGGSSARLETLTKTYTNTTGVTKTMSGRAILVNTAAASSSDATVRTTGSEDPYADFETDVLPFTEKPVDDFDRSCTSDAAVFRPSNGTWFVAGAATEGWGQAGDIPVAADYDGDGTSDVAVYRPSTGTWYQEHGPIMAWGQPGDMPVPGDYAGQGKADLAVYRPSSGQWFVNNSSTASWGIDGDLPAPGDYNGDGKTDIAVYRPSTGVWYVQGGVSTSWGVPGDIPVPGDYNCDGKTDIAVYRPSTGVWYFQGAPTTKLGQPGDMPLEMSPAAREMLFAPWGSFRGGNGKLTLTSPSGGTSVAQGDGFCSTTCGSASASITYCGGGPTFGNPPPNVPKGGGTITISGGMTDACTGSGQLQNSLKPNTTYDVNILRADALWPGHTFVGDSNSCRSSLAVGVTKMGTVTTDWRGTFGPTNLHTPAGTFSNSPGRYAAVCVSEQGSDPQLFNEAPLSIF